jgi:hypothetical protein
MQQYMMIAACLLLAIFLVWKEARRSNRSRLLLRILASILAVASLAFLAVPIYYNTVETVKFAEAILLTDGYNKDSTNAFLKQHKQAAVYTKEEYLQQNNIDILHVFGYGLSAAEWRALPASGVIFHPSAIGNGITGIGYNKKLNSGDQLLVQGMFNNISGKPVKLTLNGFGTGLDSVIIQPKTEQPFELSTIPKLIGRAVYELTATIHKDTIEQEYLPLEVVQAMPLKILLLAAWPDFENKFLQNWLFENNYVAASRTTISKNKYRYNYFDTTQFALEKITPAILSKFDVLIADGAELSSLSKQELFNIQNEVTDKGLGLLIKADSTGKPALFYHNNCSIAATADHNKQTLAVQLPGNDTASLLPVENPSFLHLQYGAQPLITDTKKNILAGNALYGKGSIVFSTFANSYYWMLSGNQKAYGLLWSSLIEKAAKNKTINKQWNVQPALPTINEPVQLTVKTSGEQTLQQVNANGFIAFAAQPFLPFEWQSTYWPVKKGWQPVVSSHGDTFWFYVFNKNDWRNIAALQKINDSYAYATSNKKQLQRSTVDNGLNKKTVPPVYFFAMFMCCCIFLWIEKKM